MTEEGGERRRKRGERGEGKGVREKEEKGRERRRKRGERGRG